MLISDRQTVANQMENELVNLAAAAAELIKIADQVGVQCSAIVGFATDPTMLLDPSTTQDYPQWMLNDVREIELKVFRPALAQPSVKTNTLAGQSSTDTTQWPISKDTASLLNVPDYKISRMVDAGELHAIKDGANTRINPNSIIAYQLKSKTTSAIAPATAQKSSEDSRKQKRKRCKGCGEVYEKAFCPKCKQDCPGWEIED